MMVIWNTAAQNTPTYEEFYLNVFIWVRFFLFLAKEKSYVYWKEIHAINGHKWAINQQEMRSWIDKYTYNSMAINKISKVK